jgi:hypothetical protein
MTSLVECDGGRLIDRDMIFEVGVG